MLLIKQQIPPVETEPETTLKQQSLSPVSLVQPVGADDCLNNILSPEENSDCACCVTLDDDSLASAKVPDVILEAGKSGISSAVNPPVIMFAKSRAFVMMVYLFFGSH